MNQEQEEQAIDAHYGHSDLASKVLDALRAAGLDSERLRTRDLEPLDQFHIGGKWATLQLLQRSPVQPGTRVLDVGGGIGGTARLLAEQRNCQVTVLDLTEAYCQVGEILTQRTGLEDKVTFRHASALDMPFPAASFASVWTQHSSMNIEDKARLYSEISRVLQPGGQLALFEVMAGANEGEPVYFPVPWADDASISFLRQPEETRKLITNADLREVSWIDMTQELLAKLQESSAQPERSERPEQQETTSKAMPALGLQLLLGDKFPQMLRNVLRNLKEGRITVIQGVFEKVEEL